MNGTLSSVWTRGTYLLEGTIFYAIGILLLLLASWCAFGGVGNFVARVLGTALWGALALGPFAAARDKFDAFFGK